MDVVVSGDSGPLHLAGALGVKYLGLYGPTSPMLTGVRSSSVGKIIYSDCDCPLPCYQEVCRRDLECMTSISPEIVAADLIKLLR